jgi:hypothetical protein
MNIPHRAVTRKLTQRDWSELSKLVATINYVKSGKCDHMIVDVETKAAILADLEAQVIALINAEVDANPGIYKRYPGDRIGLLP